MGLYDRRELARQLGDGYDVSLVWDSASDEVVVICTLRTGCRLEFSPRRHEAMDALQSPFQYAERAQAGWRASPTVETCKSEGQLRRCRQRWATRLPRSADRTPETTTEEQRP
jgi:hypothetical protein